MTPGVPMLKQSAYLAAKRMVVRWRVATEIGLWRHGWLWAAFAVLLLVTGGMRGWAHWSLMQEAQQLKYEREALAGLQREAARRDASAPDTGPARRAETETEKRAQLLAVLPPREQAGEQVRRLYQLAAQQQVLISQADFQSNAEAGGLERLQMSIPTKAGYPQLRRFVESGLRELPNASLDRLSFKRSQVGDTQIEARVYLSLWLRAGAAADSAPRAGDMP